MKQIYKSSIRIFFSRIGLIINVTVSQLIMVVLINNSSAFNTEKVRTSCNFFAIEGILLR